MRVICNYIAGLVTYRDVNMQLNEMEIGQSQIISGFSKTGLRHHTRYLSLGLIPGSSVTLLRKAPIGCPLHIKVGSTMLSIRNVEAAEVIVEDSI